MDKDGFKLNEEDLDKVSGGVDVYRAVDTLQKYVDGHPDAAPEIRKFVTWFRSGKDSTSQGLTDAPDDSWDRNGIR